MSNKYPRELRLATQTDFQNVYRQSHRYFCNKFIILTAKNDLNHPRLGISLAKKVVPLAVQRNRIKRLIRESFRITQNALKSFDIIIVIKQNVLSAETHFKMSLCEQWKKLSPQPVQP